MCGRHVTQPRAHSLFLPSSNPQDGKSKTKPDFSGTWLLDTKKSDRPYGVPVGKPDLPITISHHDPEFRITVPSKLNGQVVEFEFVFFTDGRGDNNEATLTRHSLEPDPKHGDKVITSKTEWSGDKIVTVAWFKRGNFVRYQVRDEWRLSADSKVLTQYRRNLNLRPDVQIQQIDAKIIYNRM